jgi:hypothetical protein
MTLNIGYENENFVDTIIFFSKLHFSSAKLIKDLMNNKVSSTSYSTTMKTLTITKSRLKVLHFDVQKTVEYYRGSLKNYIL